MSSHCSKFCVLINSKLTLCLLTIPVLEEEPPTLHELFDIDPPSVPPSTPTTPLDLFADLVEDLIDPGFEDSGIDLTCYETIPPSPSQSPQFPDSTVNGKSIFLFLNILIYFSSKN